MRQDKDAKRFGKRIKQLRKARGWTQTVIAARCGWSQKRQSQIEQGVSSPTVRTQKRLARVLGLEVSELMSYDHTRGVPLPRVLILARRDQVSATRRALLEQRDQLILNVYAELERLRAPARALEVPQSSPLRPLLLQAWSTVSIDPFAASDHDAGCHIFGEDG